MEIEKGKSKFYYLYLNIFKLCFPKKKWISPLWCLVLDAGEPDELGLGVELHDCWSLEWFTQVAWIWPNFWTPGWIFNLQKTKLVRILPGIYWTYFRDPEPLPRVGRLVFNDFIDPWILTYLIIKGGSMYYCCSLFWGKISPQKR